MANYAYLVNIPNLSEYQIEMVAGGFRVWYGGGRITDKLSGSETWKFVLTHARNRLTEIGWEAQQRADACQLALTELVDTVSLGAYRKRGP